MAPLSDDVLARMPKRSSIERQIRRKRKQIEGVQPPPQSRHFEIPNEYAEMV